MSEISNELFNKLYKLENESILKNNIDSNLIINEYKEISEDLICIFCNDFPLIPYNCNICQNIICQKCYEKKKPCQNECKNSKFVLVEKKLKKIIDKIQIYCVNKSKGCNEKICHKDYLKHLTNCIYNTYKCQIKDCNFKGIKKSCDHHTLYCGLKIVNCVYCQEEIVNHLYYKHFIECGNKTINCNYCNKKILKKNEEEHLDECDEVLIKCSICGFEYKRKNIHSIEECLTIELSNVSQEKNLIEKNYKKLKEENKELKENNETYKIQIKNLNDLIKNNEKYQKSFEERKNSEIETLKEKINELEIQLENEKNKNINNKRGFSKNNFRGKRGGYHQNRFRGNRRGRGRGNYNFSTNRNNSNSSELNESLDLIKPNKFEKERINSFLNDNSMEDESDN